MIPVIALVGRPNVGKSTLFNCLTKSRHALVSNFSGLTRDRQYGKGYVEDQEFIVIDTGGIEGKEAGIDEKMLEQTKLAIEEAQIIFFIVDAQAGLTTADQTLAETLRLTDKPVHLIVNKIDGLNPELATAEFYQLALGTPNSIAAVQNRGVTQLIHSVIKETDLENIEAHGLSADTPGIKLAIVGKPNVGKSTLVNRLLGEDRVIVYDQPGTTRDSIFIPLERHGRQYTVIDTAGVRRRKKVHETVEKFSVIKSLQAINTSNVVIMVIDAKEGIADQDLNLLGFILDTGKSLIIAINKWDGLDKEQKNHVRKELSRRLEFVNFAEVHFISALHGTGVGHLFDSVEAAYSSATAQHSTNKLTNLLERATAQHPPPLVHGRRIKLRYAHSGGHNPPIVVIHGNQTDKLPHDYKRYLINFYRTALKLVGTPVRIELKTTDNPFKHIRNKLTPGQIKKRKRLMQFVKAAKKRKQQK